MDLLADTTFLIDLWREQRAPGSATSFAKRSADLALGLPWVVVGEFLSGGVLAGQDGELLDAFVQRYSIIHSTDRIVNSYAQIFASVRKEGGAVGPNDLWIAACAEALDLPLVTRNAADFEVVSSIRVLSYKDGGL